MSNGGNGQRILQTFDEWMVRVNKRLTRLERRVSPVAKSDVVPVGGVVLWPQVAPVPQGWIVLDGTAIPDAHRMLRERLGGALPAPLSAPPGWVHIIRT